MNIHNANRRESKHQKSSGVYAHEGPAGIRAIEKQHRDCVRRVVALGGEVESAFADQGSSDMQIRPEFHRVLADVRPGSLDYVVVESPDRLAHSVPFTTRGFEGTRLRRVEVQTLSDRWQAPPLLLAFDRVGARRRKQVHPAGSSKADRSPHSKNSGRK